jgi:hypothetical protein
VPLGRWVSPSGSGASYDYRPSRTLSMFLLSLFGLLMS